ncbi:plasmid mobilization protein [Pedobacter foliorum]|uniref:plasmid mobilization protein n=1 Tax=Pedobacter foliorum TaxID=2739058 RepID=UPI0015640399|nr:plasmid mobilization relaxosome protein MobC [Pedobacter foliorum]NRF41131.1 plasmid mobilization relaxosome protein MobC [Pedobacter foliorum]
MKKEKINRDKCYAVRLTAAEQDLLLKNFSSTTHTRFSEYARSILLGKPMIAAVRNQSLQDIFAELVALRQDLNEATIHFSHVVQKLHALADRPLLQDWLLNYEMDRRKMLKSIEQIKVFINLTAEKWLHS